jgi:prepilin-type N-terminal cleavage/methylation domain-containing protein
MLQKLRGNSQGFTLIELMIVIAIIGILAAIAIPNFIAYRNKAFCSRAETDANNISADIADYFAIPTNVSLAGGMGSLGNPQLSGTNSATVTAGDPNVNITITVTDGSGRCPADYQAAVTQAASPDGWWDGAGVYTKIIIP